MPSEERYIKFKLDEVYKALNIYSIQENRPPLPSGELLSVVLPEAGNDERISAKIKKEDGSSEEINYERKVFGSALVFYCQASGIPLPRKGTKILNILEDQIIMKIEYAP